MTNALAALGVLVLVIAVIVHLIAFWVMVATIHDIHEKMSEKEDKE